MRQCDDVRMNLLVVEHDTVEAAVYAIIDVIYATSKLLSVEPTMRRASEAYTLHLAARHRPP